MAASEILQILVKLNLAAAAAIVLVILLRKSVRLRFGARLAYSLWLAPILAAAAVMLPARRVLTPTAPMVPLPPVAAPAVAAGPIVEAPAAALTIDPALVALGLWLVGVVCALAVMAYLQRRFTLEVGKGAIGPAVVGVLRPRIVTPSDFAEKFNDAEQALVLAHERAHLARQDSRLNGLSAAIQCLFWFNPLIHLAAHLARIDQEMACDETVVTRFPEARRAYAQALVKAQLAIRPLPLGCYWPSGTEHPLFERIAMLKRDAFGPAQRLAGAAALALVCTATGLTAWAAQPSVRVVAPVRAVKPHVAPLVVASIPEMRPTGALIPAFGSHPAGTPSTLIATTVPEMAPTGDMRLLFAPGTAPAPELALAQTPAIQPPSGGYTLQNALTEAEAAGVRVAVEGTLARVQWVNPQAMLTIVDASGQEVTVATETPNTMLRQGLNRETLKAGMPIRIDGFRGANGSVQARVSGMTSNGRALAVNDNAGRPLTAPADLGAVVERSPLTNSVIREGER